MSAGGFNASDRQQVGPKDMQDGLFVPIRGFIEGTGKFPIQKCAIFASLRKSRNCAGADGSVRRSIDFAD
jgi:hypothetical protein